MKEKCRHCGKSFNVQEVKIREDEHGYRTRHCPFCLRDLDRWYCENCDQILHPQSEAERDLRDKGTVEIRKCSFCGDLHFVLKPYSSSWPVSEKDEEARYCSYCQGYYRTVYFGQWDGRKAGYWRVYFCSQCGRPLEVLPPGERQPKKSHRAHAG